MGISFPHQDELCRQLGIGIHRLREGLAILRHQGLVAIKRRAGTRVKESTVQMLHEAIQWRLDLEAVEKRDTDAARKAVYDHVLSQLQEVP